MAGQGRAGRAHTVGRDCDRWLARHRCDDGRMEEDQTRWRPATWASEVLVCGFRGATLHRRSRLLPSFSRSLRALSALLSRPSSSQGSVLSLCLSLPLSSVPLLQSCPLSLSSRPSLSSLVPLSLVPSSSLVPPVLCDRLFASRRLAEFALFQDCGETKNAPLTNLPLLLRTVLPIVGIPTVRAPFFGLEHSGEEREIERREERERERGRGRGDERGRGSGHHRRRPSCPSPSALGPCPWPLPLALGPSFSSFSS